MDSREISDRTSDALELLFLICLKQRIQFVCRRRSVRRRRRRLDSDSFGVIRSPYVVAACSLPLQSARALKIHAIESPLAAYVQR